jgi:hypothetical protein
MISVVIKPFEVTSGKLAAGDLVDSTDWRNETSLLSQGVRRLRAASPDEIAHFEAGGVNIRGVVARVKPPKGRKPAQASA